MKSMHGWYTWMKKHTPFGLLFSTNCDLQQTEHVWFIVPALVYYNVSRCKKVQSSYSQLLSNKRGVARGGFGREVVVAVRAVKERLPPLTVTGHVRMKGQTRAWWRLQVQWTTADRGAILHLQTTQRDTEKHHVIRWIKRPHKLNS